MNLDRIKRGVLYFFVVVVAALAGFFVKKVLVDGGVFNLSAMEIVEIVISGVLVGILIPIIESRKKNRV